MAFTVKGRRGKKKASQLLEPTVFQCENYNSVGWMHTMHTHMHTNTVQLIQVSFGSRRVKPEATQGEGVEMGPSPLRCAASGTGWACCWQHQV